MPSVLQWPKRAQYLITFSSPFLDRVFSYAPRHPGRPSYGAILFQGLLVRQRLGWTYLELEEFTGIDETTFIKAEQRFTKQGLFSRFFRYLVTRLVDHRFVNPKTLAVDASFVKSYARRAEPGSGYSGYHEGNGFKLHTIVDTESQLPLTLMTSAGNHHDSRWVAPLLHALKPLFLHPRYLVADKGYDDDRIVRLVVRKLRAYACIPRRTIHRKYIPTAAAIRLTNQGRVNDPDIYRKRTAVERCFAYLKGKFHLGKERTRGLIRFTTNAYKAALCFIIEKLTKTWEIVRL